MESGETPDLEAIRQVTQAIRAEAASEARAVVVTAAPGSRIIDITYSSRAFRLGTGELSELTLDLIDQATRKADEESAKAIAPFFAELRSKLAGERPS